MPDAWHTALVERLESARTSEKAWGYAATQAAAAETTALAALALSASGTAAEDLRGPLAWLASIQQADGGVPVRKGLTACWPTALCVLAWLRTGGEEFAQPAQRGLAWLLSNSGRPLSVDRNMFRHDTTLIGWGWVDGTHSWVEPTSYAVLALKGAGHGDHARVREGVRLLLDRAIPDGGWNYGNTWVMGSMLRPFPAQTGIALTALAGEEQNTRIRAATDYLAERLPDVRSPISLAWGVIGLDAWSTAPPDSEGWLETCAKRVLARPANPLQDALLLLAAMRSRPLLSLTEAEHVRG